MLLFTPQRNPGVGKGLKIDIFNLHDCMPAKAGR